MFQVEFDLKHGALSAHVLIAPSARASLKEALFYGKERGKTADVIDPFNGNPLQNGLYAFSFNHKETADAVKNDIELYFSFYYGSEEEGKKHVRLVQEPEAKAEPVKPKTSAAKNTGDA